jgi:endonuclease/exonuclease/phosphatase family metal-dependent hydrolase
MIARNTQFLRCFLSLWTLASVCAPATGSASDTTPSKAPPPVRIMTWNIGYADLKVSPAQDRDMPHIAAVIKEADVDVVALQEQAGAKQLQLLLQLLGAKYAGKTLGTEQNRGVALLCKLPVQEYEILAFDVPWKWKLLAATIMTRAGDCRFRVVSCYAPAGRHATPRRKFAQRLMDYARPSRIPMFLAGDFNLAPTHLLDRYTPFFSDDASLDLKTYAAMTSVCLDCGINAGPTALLNRRVDYVFAVPRQLRIARAEVLSGKRVAAMDHDPLVLTVHEQELREARPSE